MSVKTVSFKTVFDKYSKLGKARNEISGHKESQVREKFTDIVDAIGIEACLLRRGDKFNSPLEIPETSVDFLVDVLDWHTSPEAKALRKGDFLNVSAKTKAWLINGFIDYLENRCYDAKVIEHQRQRMEYRMKCSLQKNLDILRITLNSIHAHVSALRNSLSSYFTYEDQVLFAEFANNKVEELADYLQDVAAYLDDGRGMEIHDSALDELNNSNDADIMERQLRQEQVFKAISKDKRYKKLEANRDAIIAEEDFVKKKKGRYQKIVEEMQAIADGYERDFFGDVMPDEPEPHFVLKHPHIALAEAIAYKKEVDEDRKEMLARPPMSEEDKERMRQHFIENFGEDPLKILKGEDEDV